LTGWNVAEVRTRMGLGAERVEAAAPWWQRLWKN